MGSDIAEGMADFGKIPKVVESDIVVGAAIVDSVGKVMVGIFVVTCISLGMSIAFTDCVGLVVLFVVKTIPDWVVVLFSEVSIESDIADGMVVVFDIPNEVRPDFVLVATIVSQDFVGLTLVGVVDVINLIVVG